MVDEINESADIAVELFDDDVEIDDYFEMSVLNSCSYAIQNQEREKQRKSGKQTYITRIPECRIESRPLYSIPKSKINTIRHQLKQQNRLLLKTYKSNAMYSCTIEEFDEMITKFLHETSAYYLVEEFDKTNANNIENNTLDSLMRKMNILLDSLVQQQSISSIQYEEMQIRRAHVQLDYLFFLPDTRQVSTPTLTVYLFH